MSKRGRKHLYDGKAGHLAVMSELLCRGWNVAIPEVDVGDDIFVVRDKDRNFLPVQVKSANGRKTKAGYKAQFSVPLIQLEEGKSPDLVYVFVVRVDNVWKSFSIIKRFDLYSMYTSDNSIGTLNKKNLHLDFFYDTSGNLKCTDFDLTTYINNWSPFPEIVDP